MTKNLKLHWIFSISVFVLSGLWYATVIYRFNISSLAEPVSTGLPLEQAVCQFLLFFSFFFLVRALALTIKEKKANKQNS